MPNTHRRSINTNLLKIIHATLERKSRRSFNRRRPFCFFVFNWKLARFSIFGLRSFVGAKCRHETWHIFHLDKRRPWVPLSKILDDMVGWWSAGSYEKELKEKEGLEKLKKKPKWNWKERKEENREMLWEKLLLLMMEKWRVKMLRWRWNRGWSKRQDEQENKNVKIDIRDHLRKKRTKTNEKEKCILK